MFSPISKVFYETIFMAVLFLYYDDYLSHNSSHFNAIETIRISLYNTWQINITLIATCEKTNITLFATCEKNS